MSLERERRLKRDIKKVEKKILDNNEKLQSLLRTKRRSDTDKITRLRASLKKESDYLNMLNRSLEGLQNGTIS